MTIRVALVSEAQAIVQLINDAFRIEQFFVVGDRIDLDQTLALFSKGEFLLAEDGTPTGCAYVEQRGDRAFLGLLSIDPARQRTGLGSRLVEAAEEWARQRNCRFMDLRIVNLREELPRFYRRRGYAEDGIEPWPADAPITKLPCHFIRMSKPL